MLNFNSLRTRLTATFIVLAIVPLLFVGGIVGYQGFTTEQEDTVDAQRALAQRIATEVNTLLETLELQLQTLITVRDLANLPEDEQTQLLNELRFFETAFDEILLLDEQGQVAIQSSRFGGSSIESYQDTPVFTSPIETGETYYGPVEYDINTNEPLITISIGLFDRRTQELQGVIVANARITTVQNVVDGLNLGENETAYIVDSENRVIAHPDISVVLNLTEYEPPSEDGIATGLDGENAVIATAEIEFSGQQFTVVTEQPVAQALSNSLNTVLLVAVTTFLALIAASILGFIAVRRVVRPIEQLATIAKEIEGGNLDQRATVKSNDELGELAQSFNSMTSQLKQTVETLEQRVSDRTRDLELAVELSRQVSTQLNPKKLVAALVERIQAEFDYHGTHILLYNPDENVLNYQVGSGDYTKGKSPDDLQLSLDAKPSIIAKCARERKPILINDISKSDEYLQLNDSEQAGSELTVPILRGQNLLGVIDLVDSKPNRFTENDQRVMSTLALNVGVAIENGRLFAEAQAAREEAEKANQIKSQFLANMSHELRTPLNAILNFTEFVADGVLGPVNEQQVDNLQKAISSGDHLLSLINDILDLSKIEVGLMELFVDDVDLNKSISSVLSTAKSLTKNKPNVELNTDIADDLPVIQGDKRRIRQILLNLMSNAIKFTEEGQVSVTAKVIDEKVHISVQDTGVGIAPEDQDLVFESFRQAEQGLVASAGTGLGLPITKHFVEAHHGKIWMESEVGVGTTFHVELPINPPVLPGETVPPVSNANEDSSSQPAQ